MASGRLRLHDPCAQERKQRRSVSNAVAVCVLVQLRIPRPVTLVFNALALADATHLGAADDWPGSPPRSTRRRTGSGCAPVDLASGLGGCPIFAQDWFFSKLLGHVAEGGA